MSTRADKQRLKSVSKISNGEELGIALAQVFQDAQVNVSSHRKLVAVLKSIQRRAADIELEEEFNLKFCKMINRVLPLKKGEAVGDRIVKFCSLFITTIQKDEEDKADGNDEEDEEDGPAARFVDNILRHLLRGIEAKDKNVRFRVVQFLAHIISDVGEIDEELYKVMIWSLHKRLYDKEPNIRIQAILSMARFQSVDQDPEADSTLNEATQRLLLTIQNDESAEVRRAALLNLEKTPETKPFLLERARDTNAINRRLVYSRIMKELGDFRSVEYDLREKLLTWGLRDRDETVQEAAVKMFTHSWLDAVNNDLIELLERLHVADSDIAETAMKTFFKSRQDKISKIHITKDMWDSLTVEIAFLIRTLYDHCIEHNMIDIIDQFYPESAELSQLLDKYLRLRKKRLSYYKSLKDKFNIDDENLDSDLEDDGGEYSVDQRIEAVQEVREMKPLLRDLDFIIQQLLLMAKDYDFSDEIGRREMLQVLRSALTHDYLQDKSIGFGLQALRKISINERDFCSMCAEIVTDIRDSVLDEIEIDDTFHSAVSDVEEEDDDDEDDEETRKSKRQKLIPKEPREPPEYVIVQCLLITQHLFELTEEPLRDNLSLTSLVDTLVTPAVLKKGSLIIRAMGIKCLGLCCLLDKKLAVENLYLFGMCAAKGDEDLRVTSIKIIVDILAVHGTSVLDVEDGVDYISLAKLFYRVLRMNDMAELQSVTAEGLCKLFLADILTDEDLFEALVLTYFNPLYNDNASLRQALTFCIPVYAFSHPTHQDKIAKLSGDCFYRLFSPDSQYSQQEQELASPTVILQQLIHWADPVNVVNRTEEDVLKSPAHLILAITLLEVVEQDTPKNIKKVIITNLSKLRISSKIDLKVLKGLKDAVEDTRKCIWETNSNNAQFKLDIPTTKAFEKFTQSVEKLIEDCEKAEMESDSGNSSVISRANRTASQSANSSRGKIEVSRRTSRSKLDDELEKENSVLETNVEKDEMEVDDPVETQEPESEPISEEKEKSSESLNITSNKSRKSKSADGYESDASSEYGSGNFDEYIDPDDSIGPRAVTRSPKKKNILDEVFEKESREVEARRSSRKRVVKSMAEMDSSILESSIIDSSIIENDDDRDGAEHLSGAEGQDILGDMGEEGIENDYNEEEDDSDDNETPESDEDGE